MKSDHKYSLKDALVVARPSYSNSAKETKYSLHSTLQPKEIIIGRTGVMYKFLNWSAPVPEKCCFRTIDDALEFIKSETIHYHNNQRVSIDNEPQVG